MKILNELRHFGYFWKDNKPNTKVIGLLTIKKDSNIILETFGQSLGFNGNNEACRILGALDNGRVITLDYCTYVSSHTTFSQSSFTTAMFQANLAIFGVHFQNDEAIELNNISFSFEYIEEWINNNSLRFNTIRTNNYSDEFNHKGINLLTTDDKLIDLVQCYRRQKDDNQTSEKRQIYINIRSSSNIIIEDLFPIVTNIQAFFIFAMDTYTDITEIRSYLTNSQNSTNKQIEIYWKNNNLPSREYEYNKYNIFLSFHDIKNELSQILQVWLELCEIITPSIFLFIKTKEIKNEISDFDFLALAQAAESLHRRIFKTVTIQNDEYEIICNMMLNAIDEKHRVRFQRILEYGNEVKFSKRLEELIKPYKTFFGNKKIIDTLVYKIVKVRNYLTHYDENTEAKRIYDNDLYYLVYVLDNLLKINLLACLKLNEEKEKSILNIRFK